MHNDLKEESPAPIIGWLGAIQRMPVASRLFSHIPPREFGPYLLIGLWNTAFGYGSFALLVWLLQKRIPYGYVLGGLLSSLLSITVAFFGYKFFVFKTKGNYLREWLRCLMVYSGGIAIGTVLLPAVVIAIRYLTGMKTGAPYLAGALMMAVNILYSFIGHKKFSFRTAA